MLYFQLFIIVCYLANKVLLLLLLLLLDPEVVHAPSDYTKPALILIFPLLMQGLRLSTDLSGEQPLRPDG